LFTKNPTWLYLELNPDRRCGKPETNRLSYEEVLGNIKILHKRKVRIRLLCTTEIRNMKASVKTGKAAC
jgi:hypothetical protein